MTMRHCGRCEGRASKYWLGVQCEPASEALRDQLGLPKDQGLVVVRVVAGAPAGKADIRPNDLLLTAGGKKLNAVADLAAAVEAAKEESLKLQLLRGGKTIDVAVRPALRPENPQANLMQPGSDQETVERWLKQFGMNLTGRLGQRNYVGASGGRLGAAARSERSARVAGRHERRYSPRREEARRDHGEEGEGDVAGDGR